MAKRTVHLAAAFFGLLAFYWLVFHPTFIDAPSQPVEFLAASQFEFADLEASSPEALKAASFEAAAPGIEQRDAGLYALRASFEIDAVPQDGLALLGIATGDNLAHFVNGVQVGGRGSMEMGSLEYRANLRTIGRVPASALKPGVNTVTVVSAIETSREILLAPPLLADYPAATEAFAWKEFLQSSYLQITVAASLTLALLIGAVALRSSARALTVWLFLLVLGWGLHSLIPIWITFPIAGVARIWCFFASFVLLSVAWPCFVDEWTGRPLRFFKLIVGGAALVVGLAGTVLAFANPDYFTARFAEQAMNALGIFYVLATALRIAWHFVTNRGEPRIWEGAIMLLLLFLSAWHLYFLIFTDENNFILHRSQPFLLLALAIGFFAGRFHLFRSAQQIADELREKVLLREAELAEAHSREKLLVREQAFSDERQRIMRDMHDGLGSQLMGMLLAARRGKAEPERVAEGLQQVIEEMRLMIDSMDSVNESLAAALAGFRTRMQPRVEDAGFRFSWTNELGGDLPAYPPRKTLQLFRIMQEAVTNALKHSGGEEIAVLLRRLPEDGQWLEVTITDDGSGIEGQRLGGHGLENMRARAEKESGRLEILKGDGGTGGRVRVLFPLDRGVDAG